jgi:3,4-dihydroxy-2-butanone 4-phosphate synthase
MLKRLLRRLRGFMQAELMAEIAALRGEMARRDELAPLVRQMEAALLTIALAGAQDPRPPGPDAPDAG